MDLMREGCTRVWLPAEAAELGRRGFDEWSCCWLEGDHLAYLIEEPRLSETADVVFMCDGRTTPTP